MKQLIACVAVLALEIPSMAASKKSDVADRLGAAATVFDEVMQTGDKSIPQELLEKAHCAVVVPGLKQGAFIFGAKYGRGFMTCRKAGGTGWSAPGSVRVEGGSIGLQIGGAEVDVIMLVMNEKGAEKLYSSKFTLGGQGEVAAGPIGRSSTAQTDAQMRAEILSWSRSRGVFAGVSLQGATLREHQDDNEALYGRRLTNRQVIEGSVAVPDAAKRLITLLTKYSAKEMK